MNYTKGERQLYCGEQYWIVEVIDKSSRPNIIVGRFNTKEDALLDAAAPEIYEALKALADSSSPVSPKKAHEMARKALAKAERKEE